MIGYLVGGLGIAAVGGAVYELGRRALAANVAAVALRFVRAKRAMEGRRLTTAELQSIAQDVTRATGRAATTAWMETVSEMVEREFAGGPKTRAARVMPPRAA